MVQNLDQLLQQVVGVSVFVLVLSIWAVAVLLWWVRRSARMERIQQRLDSYNRTQRGAESRVLRLWRHGKEATTVVPGERPRTLLDRLEDARQTAAIQASLPVVLMGIIGATALTALVTVVLTNSIIVAAIAGAAVVLVCWIAFQQRLAKRLALFETQLVDALELAARSLRAGHPLTGSFRLISEEIEAPVGAIFTEINQQQGLGMPLENALRRSADRSASDDFKLFASSVIIQVRSGGNLADMMERVAMVIRDRLRLARRVRVLTAQTQFSKRLLIALPILMFAFLNVINPQYMMPLYATAAGRILLIVAASGLLVGALVMNRLAKIRY